MKIIRNPMLRFFFSVILGMFISLPLQAGTFDNLYFIGFSKDGKHIAFETYGESDGTGHGYSSIRIVDVAKNSWVGDAIETGTEADMYSEELARARNRVKALEQLNKLGIEEGAVGDHVVSRKLNDLTEYTGPVRFAEFLTSNFQRGDYELHLTEKPASREECDVYTPPARKIFDLVLKDRKSGVTQPLQQDTRLPKSRFCPDKYEISDVYLNNKKLVVFLRMYGPGFEGPDMRYLVVTGNIK